MTDHHSFLTASAMIARQALADVDNDPARAAGRWLDLAREPWFRDGVLVSYIAVIAASTDTGEGHDHAPSVTQPLAVDPSPVAAGNDQFAHVTQSVIVDPAADYSAEERHDHWTGVTQSATVDRPSADPAALGHDQRSDATQSRDVDPGAAGPSHSVDERHDQIAIGTHAGHVDRSAIGAGGASSPASPIREPSPQRRQASRRVRRQEMLDSVCIIERNGARTPLKDIAVKRLPSLRRWFGRHAWANGLQHNLILALENKTSAMLARNQIQPSMLLREIFTDDQLNTEVTAARITTTAATIILPVDIERTQRGLWPGLPTPAA
jgi:hypothetical protein